MPGRSVATGPAAPDNLRMSEVVGALHPFLKFYRLNP